MSCHSGIGKGFRVYGGACLLLSVALAGLPLVNSLAVTELQDTIQASVAESCTLERTVGDGNYSATVQAGTVYSPFVTSTYKVICNNATGFTVDAVFTKLSGTGEAITYGNVTPDATHLGIWTAYTSFNSANIAGTWQAASSTYTGGVLMSANSVTAAAGQTATVTYKIGIRDNQAAGTYTGTATYTLNQNS